MKTRCCTITCHVQLTWPVEHLGVLLVELRAADADSELLPHPEVHNGAIVAVQVLQELMEAAGRG